MAQLQALPNDHPWSELMTQTMTDDRLDWHFANWASWQRAEYTLAHGYPQPGLERHGTEPRPAVR
jgi:hypothetical protein